MDAVVMLGYCLPVREAHPVGVSAPAGAPHVGNRINETRQIRVSVDEINACLSGWLQQPDVPTVRGHVDPFLFAEPVLNPFGAASLIPGRGPEARRDLRLGVRDLSVSDRNEPP